MAATQPGPTLGKYELLRRIGQGGMAEVYLARTRSIGGFERLVVIKRLLPRLAQDAAFVRMFLDEARIAAQLHHSNIGQVYDVDTADGAVFYAMEYLRGHDVAQLGNAVTAKGPFPLDQVIAIGISICAGLHYAHQLTDAEGDLLHLVHRDVTPHNVVVTFDGGVKIIDFGIAKVTGARTETQAGALRGKIRYMSPEQVLAQPLDGRSDIFATSNILYELATGTRLFDYSEYDALHAIVYTDVLPPSSRRADFPKRLEQILLRGLARDRAARYATALDMQVDLQAFAREQQLDVSPLGLSRLIAEAFPDEAAQSTRPVLETLRVDTGLWALGEGGEVDKADGFMTTAADQPLALETRTLPSEPRRSRRRGVWAAAFATLLVAGAAAVWSLRSDDSSRAEGPQSPAAPTTIESAATVPPPAMPPEPAAATLDNGAAAPTAAPASAEVTTPPPPRPHGRQRTARATPAAASSAPPPPQPPPSAGSAAQPSGGPPASMAQERTSLDPDVFLTPDKRKPAQVGSGASQNPAR